MRVSQKSVFLNPPLNSIAVYLRIWLSLIYRPLLLVPPLPSERGKIIQDVYPELKPLPLRGRGLGRGYLS
jgi:hypothetical protein